ncbi:hypothetical protein ACOXXX_00405 [Thalassococcus sp. BH17M4-6]|uniref:hypothetical protein n=1 Tax=Thalassococcus sp. BH17M4-6 TaxID=3413148 RepID=UPI003BD8AD87
MFKFLMACIAGGLVLAAPAKALVIDFTQAGLTDQSGANQQTIFAINYGSGASAGSLTMGVTSNQGAVTFANPFPGTTLDPAPSFCTNGTLACDTGGAGVRSTTLSTGQQLGVSLSASDQALGYSVRIQEFYFLNLVFDSALPSGEQEAAFVRYNSGGFDETFAATDSSQVGALAAAATSADASSTIGFLLDAGQFNDSSLLGDYSLAGIRFSLLFNGELVDTTTEDPMTVVPLPASALLLLAGLASIGALRLRARRT